MVEGIKTLQHATRLKILEKQNEYLNALIRNSYKIEDTCKAIGISRTLYYDWMKRDKRFKAQIEIYREREIDMMEDSFKALVKEKNPQIVMFGLKTRGAHRGYQEQQQINLFGTAGIKIEIIDPNQVKENEKVVKEVKDD